MKNCDRKSPTVSGSRRQPRSRRRGWLTLPACYGWKNWLRQSPRSQPPQTAVVTTGNFAVRQLDTQAPNLRQLREASAEIGEDGTRASGCGCCMTEADSMVFVVDDDPSVRRAIKRLIGSVGRQVELFASAHEFLASKPANGGASCLVLDIRLPGISGLDFQRQLADAKVQIPIVFITAHGDIPMTVRAMKAGAVEFLTKPFRDQDLLDAIQVALERDRSRRQQESDLAVLRERFELLSPREREVVTTVPFSTLFSTTSLASANNSVPQGRNPPARRCRSSLASGNRRSQTMALSPISA